MGDEDHHLRVWSTSDRYGPPDGLRLRPVVPELRPGVRHHLPSAPLRAVHQGHQHLRLGGRLRLRAAAAGRRGRAVPQASPVHLLPRLADASEGAPSHAGGGALCGAEVPL